MHAYCRSPDKVADGMDMLTATQVACKAELCDAEAMCIDSSKGSDQLTDGRPGLPMQDQDWQDIVYRVCGL